MEEKFTGVEIKEIRNTSLWMGHLVDVRATGTDGLSVCMGRGWWWYRTGLTEEEYKPNLRL